MFVKALIIVDTCPTYLLCSISVPPVVLERASLKQNAKALFTKLIALESTGILSAATVTSFSIFNSFSR